MQDNKHATSEISKQASEEVKSMAFGMDSVWVPIVVGGQAVAAIFLADQIQVRTVWTQTSVVAIVLLSMVFPLGRYIHESFIRRRLRKTKRTAETASA